jgi:hypothetical protein
LEVSVIGDMGTTHGEKVEGDGEEKGQKRIEAEFSLRFVATGLGHRALV